MQKIITFLLLLIVIMLTGCSKTPIVLIENKEQSAERNKETNLIYTDAIGSKGGEIKIDDANHPLSGLSIRVNKNTFDSPVNISIEPIEKTPEKKGCEVYRGLKIFSDEDIALKGSFLRLTLPFKEKRRNDMEVKLVYPYYLSSSKWSKDFVTPLPGPSMDIFVGAISDISNDIVYFPVKCDLMESQ